ncbi:hypothetical protein [Sphingobium cloacae]|uniref:hypothetical protein n=1 Tax=Sphingobium cloacae TaxID=120107 RepID=UPI000F508E89|nr:hypothetical protein [Sphingobium cloacae]
MRIVLISSAILILVACGEPDATIPVDQGTGFRDGYLVQVTRSGNIEWNGAKIDETEFKRYVGLYAAMPKEAGRLWVEFEPDAPSSRIAFVRRHVVGSGLCKQQRCVEGLWNVPRPVVN